MPRCRPGDLALVLVGENAGAFVDVLRAAPPHPFTGGDSWECRSRAAMTALAVSLVTGDVLKSFTVPAGAVICFADADLQPIRPPGVSRETSTETELEIAA